MPQQWNRRRLLRLSGTIGILGLTGCIGGSSTNSWDIDEPITVASAQQYNSPECSCCAQYASYIRENITGDLSETVPDEIQAVKQEYGIPEDLQSCHTLVLTDYVVEGHVPVEVIVQLLDEDPPIDGIALPGMPPGTPGMGGEKDGSLSIYAIGGDQAGAEYTEV
uniref:DUF411 domain-containing protein n=1 Tax=Haloprofundus sp. MHR1 TaxID=2572921 RepID=UPI001F3F5375|nr:DUF411 domain-containing protein [Haloprofundus sp. MHR1]